MKKLLFICFLYLLISQNTFAQTPHFRNYTVDDGLPSSHVYRAFQDSKGFMWFCTDKGIARFDGYKFEKFTTKNGLPNNDIWHCAEDSQQRIWFLSYANAFFYFDLKDNKFHVIENPYKELHDTYVWCYLQNTNNSITVISANHLTLTLDTKTKKVFNSNLKYGSYYPFIRGKNYIEKDGSRGFEIWHLRAFSEGFGHNLSKKTHVTPPISLIKKPFWNNAVSIIFDDDKTIYGNNDSISYFKNNRLTTALLKKLSNYPDDKLTLILNAGDKNRKLIVTEKDIFIINQNLERIKTLDYVKDFNVNTVYFDSENNLWLCTKNRGIYLLSSTAINSKVFEKFAEKMSITSLTQDSKGNIWFGNNAGEVFFVDHKKNISPIKFDVIKKKPVKQIITSKNYTVILWNDSDYAVIKTNSNNYNKTFFLKDIINTLPIRDEGIYIKSFKKLNQKDGIFKLQNVKVIDVFSEDKFILGNTQNIRLLECFPDYYKLAYRDKGTINIKILAIKSIDSSFFYVGTNRGIEVITNDGYRTNIEKLKSLHKILSKPITFFTSDSQNALWVGTDGYGIYRLQNNKIAPIPELSGLIVNHLFFEKQNNRLFISTNEGIFVLNLTMKADGFSYSIKRISLAQGLPTLEVNCSVVRDGELFVGTSKGLATLPLAIINKKPTEKNIIPLIIKNIKINRQDTTLHSFYNLNYRQNNLDIEFVALSFKSDKNIKYNYKMLSSNDNADTAWHSVQDLHKEFSLLSSGKYEFHLQAFDIDGTPSQPLKPIVFVINPPFWETLWFKTLIILFALLLIILYFFIRTQNIKKKEEEKTEINKKFAELELQALQAQMNPHFVFNALSAIQNFILNNNTEEATNFLSKFSRLMRLFLESSRNKYIALSEEKVLLEYYIQLEELRFKGKFTSKIQIDDSVSLDTEIPSMLLQPFVENAINHGLVYKENNDGFLHIHFKQDENKLVCIIEDNGIGRQKAAEIKSKSLKPYKSRSTEITEERLRSLELIENTKIEVSILDKQDTNQTAVGTKVMIVMYL